MAVSLLEYVAIFITALYNLCKSIWATGRKDMTLNLLKKGAFSK
jgi:hypothetical protein